MEPLGALDPRRLGDWEIVGRLGHGGMGVVYLARRTVAGRVREAAVKTISPQLRSEPESLARFRREVAVLMGLEIPGAVGVLSADLDGDPFWYATQYIEGPDLQAYVRSRGPMPPDLHRALSWSLLDTLARIHQRGITHRDLKPGNVLLGPDGPLIIDFGIAFVRGAMTLTQGMWGPGTPA